MIIIMFLQNAVAERWGECKQSYWDSRKRWKKWCMWGTGHSTGRTSGTVGAAVKLFVTYLQTMTKDCSFWETWSHSGPSRHEELLMQWHVTSQGTWTFFWIIYKTHHGILLSWSVFRGLGRVVANVVSDHSHCLL